jgi:hypothetical protein
MSDTLDVRDTLIRLRDDQLRKLVDLARNRRAAEEILEKAYQYERAAAALAPNYGKHKSAIIAILDFLENVGRPAGEEEIIRALADGGFRSGDADIVRTKVRQCIRGHKTMRIKEENGLIGRAEWDKSRFEIKPLRKPSH